MAKKLKIDWLLFAITAGLALFGAVMVYSSSAIISLDETDGGTQFAFFYKQLAATLIGLVVMYLTSKVDYKWYQHPYAVYGFYGLTIALLIGVFFVSGDKWGPTLDTFCGTVVSAV